MNTKQCEIVVEPCYWSVENLTNCGSVTVCCPVYRMICKWSGYGFWADSAHCREQALVGYEVNRTEWLRINVVEVSGRTDNGVSKVRSANFWDVLRCLWRKSHDGSRCQVVDSIWLVEDRKRRIRMVCPLIRIKIVSRSAQRCGWSHCIGWMSHMAWYYNIWWVIWQIQNILSHFLQKC